MTRQDLQDKIIGSVMVLFGAGIVLLYAIWILFFPVCCLILTIAFATWLLG